MRRLHRGCRGGEHEGNQNRLVEHEPHLGVETGSRMPFWWVKHCSSKSKYGNVAALHVIVVFRGNIIRAKRESIVLVEERVSQLPFDPSHVSFLGRVTQSWMVLIVSPF